MSHDFSLFFQEYEQFLLEIDKIFSNIQAQCPDRVLCQTGCCECCYALFDLSLVEAMYLNRKFKEILSAEQRDIILERANWADRQIVKIKRQANRSRQKGEDTDNILEFIGKQKVRCPLLTDENLCALYDYRPVTCRLYGIPMQIGQEVHTCSLSGFIPGHKYPTAYMEKIHKRLLNISQRMIASIPTKHTKLAEMYVPVSMALLTEYDDDYLGIVQSPVEKEKKENEMEWTLGDSEGE